LRATLKKARKDKSMTQRAVAEHLGITLRHYQKIEGGDANGSFRVWDALEDILGIHQRKLRESLSNHPVQEDNQ